MSEDIHTPFDQVLPGFDEPQPRPVRPRSAKDEDDERQVKYRRFASTASVHCQDCINELQSGRRSYPHQAAWTRTQHTVSRLLCQFHKIEQEARDDT